MKKLLAVIGLVGFVAAGVVIGQVAYVSIWSDHTGLHIGAKSTDAIAFRDATPSGKKSIGLTLTNGAALAECVTKLQNIHDALVTVGLCQTNAP
jgi:hypothetical protein